VAAVRELVETFGAMCRGEVARAEHRPDPEAWSTAAERWDRLGQPYPAAYARLRRAEALLSRRSRSADAAADLTRAAAVATQLGARPLLARIDELAGRARIGPAVAGAAGHQTTAAGVPPNGSGATPHNSGATPNGAGAVPEPRTTEPTELDALTPRELEVLEVMATGLTNREIAERLFISEKTVGVHLTRVFTKIGVHSRVQASAVLHRSRRPAAPPDGGGHPGER
jgi:DNA-binding NarL/FixJ family response regulator